MSKFLTTVGMLLMMGWFAHTAKAQEIPGMGSTKDMVRLSLWYQGMATTNEISEAVKSPSKEKKNQVVYNEELKKALENLDI